jgi:hypothetical protein
VIVAKHLTAARRITVAVVAAFLAAPAPLRAASDCPSALSGKGSFILERRAGSQMEVFYDESPTIRTSLRVGDRVLLETTLYQGLFELRRVDRGTRIEQTPKTDLGKFFPLKPKPTIAVDFDVAMSGHTQTKTVKLQYVGSQDYALGDCSYRVVKLRRIERLPILYDNIDYYAPELRYVVAKEYRESDGRTTIVGYNRISSGKPHALEH